MIAREPKGDGRPGVNTHFFSVSHHVFHFHGHTRLTAVYTRDAVLDDH